MLGNVRFDKWLFANCLNLKLFRFKLRMSWREIWKWSRNFDNQQELIYFN